MGANLNVWFKGDWLSRPPSQKIGGWNSQNENRLRIQRELSHGLIKQGRIQKNCRWTLFARCKVDLCTNPSNCQVDYASRGLIVLVEAIKMFVAFILAHFSASPPRPCSMRSLSLSEYFHIYHDSLQGCANKHHGRDLRGILSTCMFMSLGFAKLPLRRTQNPTGKDNRDSTF